MKAADLSKPDVFIKPASAARRSFVYIYKTGCVYGLNPPGTQSGEACSTRKAAPRRKKTASQGGPVSQTEKIQSA
jgi:hypothetical protein